MIFASVCYLFFVLVLSRTEDGGVDGEREEEREGEREREKKRERVCVCVCVYRCRCRCRCGGVAACEWQVQ